MFLYTALFLGILLGRTFGSIDEQIPKCDFILSYKYSNYLMEWLVTYICIHIECSYTRNDPNKTRHITQSFKLLNNMHNSMRMSGCQFSSCTFIA